jgi:hypothetical protein
MGSPAILAPIRPLDAAGQIGSVKQRVVGWNAQDVLDKLGSFVRDSGEPSMAWLQAWVFEPTQAKIPATDTPAFGVPVTVRPPQA